MEPILWTGADVRRRLHLEDSAAVISTVYNMDVPVRVELHASAPMLDLNEADHAVEGPLCTNGEIVVVGCTNYLSDAARAVVSEDRLRHAACLHGPWNHR